MGFQVVQGSPQNIWVPIVDSDIIYTGSLVSLDASGPTEGFLPLPAAAGASNTTNLDIPFGVCIGNNFAADSETYSTTYNTGYITDSTPHGSTVSYQGVEGPGIAERGQAMALISLIGPDTIIKGPIRNAAVGTAPTVVTVTVAGATGVGCTTGAADVATVAVYSTIYFRSGANEGSYRIPDSASDTTHTWDKPTYAGVAVGDTAVVINGLRPHGISRMQVGTEALYIDCAAALTSDYFLIDVIGLYLGTAGDEYVEFRFNMDNFCSARA